MFLHGMHGGTAGIAIFVGLIVVRMLMRRGGRGGRSGRRGPRGPWNM
jgi:hypothetical protein